MLKRVVDYLTFYVPYVLPLIIGFSVLATMMVPAVVSLGFVTGVSNVDGGPGVSDGGFRDTVIVIFWGDAESDLIMAAFSILYLGGVLLGSVAALIVSPHILYVLCDYLSVIPVLVFLFWCGMIVKMLVWKNE